MILHPFHHVISSCNEYEPIYFTSFHCSKYNKLRKKQRSLIHQKYNRLEVQTLGWSAYKYIILSFFIYKPLRVVLQNRNWSRWALSFFVFPVIYSWRIWFSGKNCKRRIFGLLFYSMIKKLQWKKGNCSCTSAVYIYDTIFAF